MSKYSGCGHWLNMGRDKDDEKWSLISMSAYWEGERYKSQECGKQEIWEGWREFGFGYIDWIDNGLFYKNA